MSKNCQKTVTVIWDGKKNTLKITFKVNQGVAREAIEK